MHFASREGDITRYVELLWLTIFFFFGAGSDALDEEHERAALYAQRTKRHYLEAEDAATGGSAGAGAAVMPGTRGGYLVLHNTTLHDVDGTTHAHDGGAGHWRAPLWPVRTYQHVLDPAALSACPGLYVVGVYPGGYHHDGPAGGGTYWAPIAYAAGQVRRRKCVWG